MEQNKIRYDAFISYRHAELDTFVAQTLHKKLEEFKLPKNLDKVYGELPRKKIERIFRDRDELPLSCNLSDQISMALAVSDYLIVICSPRIKESLWCRQEITQFTKLHGHERVLAVLIEGEPEDSFPEEILYKEVLVKDAFGQEHMEKVAIEPLAADVRGKDKAEIKKKIQEEILRLAAPMFEVRYDDLKQRHHERRVKRIAGISISVASVFMAFGIVSGMQSMQIRQKNKEIKKQNEEITEQTEKLQEQFDKISRRQAIDYAEKSEQALHNANREEALRYALMSVTEDEDGNTMPETQEGLRALMGATYVYDIGSFLTPEITYHGDYQYVLQKVADSCKYVLQEDCMGVISIIDTTNLEVIFTCNSNGEDYINRDMGVGNTTCFFGDTLIFYTTGNQLVLHDFVKDEIVFTLDFEEFGKIDYVKTTNTSDWAILVSQDKAYYYDHSTGKIEQVIEKQSQKLYSIYGFQKIAGISEDGEYVVLLEEKQDEDTREDYDVLQVYSREKNQLLWEKVFKEGCDQAILIQGDQLLFAETELATDFSDMSNLDSRTMLWCMELSSGKDIWEQEFQDDDFEISDYSTLLEPMTVDGVDYYVYTLGQEVYLVNALSGEKVSVVDFGSIITGIEVRENGVVIVYSYDGIIFYTLLRDSNYIVKQNNFGEDMAYLSIANHKVFCLQKDTKTPNVWAYHMGNRAEKTAFQGSMLSSKCTVDTNMEYLISSMDQKLQVIDVKTGKTVWEKASEDTIEHVEAFSNGTVLVMKTNGFQIFSLENGKLLFETDEDATYELLNMDQEKQSFVYSKDWNRICMFDTNERKEKDIYTFSDILAQSMITANATGEWIAYINNETNQVEIAKKGGNKLVLEVNAMRVHKMICFPTSPYLFIQYDNYEIDIYNTTDGSLVKSYEKHGAGYQWIREGTDLYPYCIEGGAEDTMLLGPDFEVVYEDTTMKKIYGKDYFYFIEYVNSDESCLWFVPCYDFEMLKKDAKLLLDGKISDIY